MHQQYKNVICPWQTASEIKAQERFLRKLQSNLDDQAQVEVFGLDKPDRIWEAKEGQAWCHEINGFK